MKISVISIGDWAIGTVSATMICCHYLKLKRLLNFIQNLVNIKI